MSFLFPIAVFYVHPELFRPLFAELDRRGIADEAIDAANRWLDPSVKPPYCWSSTAPAPRPISEGTVSSPFTRLRGFGTSTPAGPYSDTCRTDADS